MIAYRKEFPVHEPRIRRFSDAVVIDLSLGKNFNRVPMDGVLRTLITCAGVMLGQLAVGQPIRGGIDMGVAIEASGNELFGPVAVSAYHLESKEADYPRIVVGKNFVDYLQWRVNRPENDTDAELNRHIASQCFPLLARDTDGKVILDYLGQGFRSFAGQFLIPIDIPRKANDFVREQAANWQTEGNAKLARRYALLRSYFKSRMPVWE